METSYTKTLKMDQHTDLTAGACYVKWTRIARETTTNCPTLSVVHARITSTVVIVCIYMYQTLLVKSNTTGK